jgi:glycine oxidase
MFSNRTRREVLVVGGGVIGLAVADALARSGMGVTVLERDRCGAGATDAAGGMLAPLGEARSRGPFLELAMESLALYPDFVGRIEAASGHRVGFRVCGKLLVAYDPEDGGRLAERARWQRAEGFAARLLDGPGAREIEPGLSSEVLSALHLPTDAVVDNRRLAAALALSARAAGAVIREGSAAERLLVAGGGVAGVGLVGGERLHGRHVVLAAGAWSAALRGLPRPLPVRPVRGQMLALSAPSADVRGLIAAPAAYLVPRGPESGGRIVIGATQEEVGFRSGTEPDAIAGLRAAAERALPSLVGAPERERWSGFRPGTPDELPFLGPDPELDGLVYACGHFRNGILLAPATASRLERLLVRGDGSGLEPFRVDRFGDP